MRRPAPKKRVFNIYDGANVEDFVYLRFNDKTGEVQADKTRQKGVANFHAWLAAKNRAAANIGAGFRYTPPG